MEIIAMRCTSHVVLAFLLNEQATLADKNVCATAGGKRLC